MKLNYPEGATPIDGDLLAGLIPSLSTQKELNEFEQYNIGLAIKWAQKSRKLRSGLLTISSLKLLHKKMFDQTWKWAGEFRKSNTNIGVEWYIIPEDLKKLCDDTKFWIENKAFGWDELAIRFHHRLVSIHPFPNGNGRHSRLATDLFLEQNGNIPFSWGGGRNIQAKGPDRKEYISALHDADGGSFENLLKFARS